MFNLNAPTLEGEFPKRTSISSSKFHGVRRSPRANIVGGGLFAAHFTICGDLRTVQVGILLQEGKWATAASGLLGNNQTQRKKMNGSIVYRAYYSNKLVQARYK